MNQNHRMVNIDSTYECVEPPDDENYKIKAHHQVMIGTTSPTVKVDAPPLPPPLPQWNHSGMNNRMQRNYRNSDDSLDDHANSDQVNGKFSFDLFKRSGADKSIFLLQIKNQILAWKLLRNQHYVQVS